METIGFVGLGHMGGNMAARLLAAGYSVYGEERNREGAQWLVDQGLRWLDTPREIAEAADVVLTSLPSDDVVESVASGADGVLAGLGAGKLWVDLSTVSPRVSRELAARVRDRRAEMLDAPVSGSVPQVKAGTLTIMVGGDEKAYGRVEPVLRVLGTPPGSATTARGWCSSSRSTSASPCRCSPSPRVCSSPSTTGSIPTSPPR
jgi:3-hydroxyisobutyrate dehydrogenase